MILGLGTRVQHEPREVEGSFPNTDGKTSRSSYRNWQPSKSRRNAFSGYLHLLRLYCSCRDFRGNILGICWHIMYLMNQLEK